jgi:hypothetical protein
VKPQNCYSISKSKRYLRWQRRRAPRRTGSMPTSAPPCRLNIIFDLEMEFGTTQAQVSALMRCRPVSVSIGRLMEFLTILGQDVELTVKPAASHKKGQQGHMSVMLAPSRS